ncbi:MAG: RnfABCDGE type electron transport complex subunit D [Fibrobacteres bacterium]|nr:RnfABCDGE type electron transport complex subunit D [Fibrobacterota bacterium]
MAENKISFPQIDAAPHIGRRDGVTEIMGTVALALLPASLFGIYMFGMPSLVIMLVSIASCVFFDWLFIKAFGNAGRISDLSAVVTGILLAMNLPPSAPFWLAIVGGLVAMLLGKHIFGGIGSNPFNPALVARVFLLIAWPAQMSTFAKHRFMADTETGATPLTILKTDGLGALQNTALFDHYRCAMGYIGGSLGEISALALLLGALFLFIRGYISWHTPFSFIVAFAAPIAILWRLDPTQYADPLFHVLTGGLILGAFFMATDMVSSPITKKGQIIFGAGCGLISAAIRLFGSYPEGVSFAILFMNALTPAIDRLCPTKPTTKGIKK